MADLENQISEVYEIVTNINSRKLCTSYMYVYAMYIYIYIYVCMYIYIYYIYHMYIIFINMFIS